LPIEEHPILAFYTHPTGTPFSIPLMIFEAFSMLVIAALDVLMITCASTIMVFLPIVPRAVV
jgi:hypothetical protein